MPTCSTPPPPVVALTRPTFRRTSSVGEIKSRADAFTRDFEHAAGRHRRYRSGRLPPVSRRSLCRQPESCGNRPFHKRGTGCAARPRCWRSRRTAVSSSCPIEQRPSSRFICSFTPTTDTRANPAALPSPARAVELARANAALSETSVPGGSLRPACTSAPTRSLAAILQAVGGSACAPLARRRANAVRRLAPAFVSPQAFRAANLVASGYGGERQSRRECRLGDIGAASSRRCGLLL
jgi:hypothetical protein